MAEAPRYQLAQVNIARLRESTDAPLLADFMTALDPVNAIADAAAGFVWRLQTDEGNATSIQAFDWDAGESAGVIINMSVWADLDALKTFVRAPEHMAVLRRRSEWFHRMEEAYLALWWVPAGHRPTTDEAEDRVRHLRQHGPTEYAFTLRGGFPPPSG